jgi:hypothetical protein
MFEFHLPPGIVASSGNIESLPGGGLRFGSRTDVAVA